ncbi:MAG TPA: hypothetical protein VGI39_37955 [Polyangiaceae bacterium]|jgi:hypothetical protein
MKPCPSLLALVAQASTSAAAAASLLAACATDPAPRLSHEPQGVDSADAGAGTAAAAASSLGTAPSASSSTDDASTSSAAAACTPNLGSHCASDQDCAQCADVRSRNGLSRVKVTTAVECVDAVCKKTGCPTERCPQGQVCTGCEVNLPCQCRDAGDAGAVVPSRKRHQGL